MTIEQDIDFGPLDDEQTTAVIDFSVTDSKIAQWREEFMALVVVDIRDEQQVDAVRNALQTVAGSRILVEKTRKALVAPHLDQQRKINAEAKRITAQLEPIEDHLADQYSKLEKERDRLRKEREAAIRQANNERLARLKAVGVIDRSYDEVAAYNDADFDALLADATQRWAAAEEARQATLAAEQAARDELAAERAELRRQQAELEARAKKLEEDAAAVAKATQEAEEQRQRLIAAENKARQDEEAKQAFEKILADAKAEDDLNDQLAAWHETEPSVEAIEAAISTGPVAEEFKLSLREAIAEIGDVPNIGQYPGEPKTNQEKLLALASQLDALDLELTGDYDTEVAALKIIERAADAIRDIAARL